MSNFIYYLTIYNLTIYFQFCYLTIYLFINTIRFSLFVFHYSFFTIRFSLFTILMLPDRILERPKD